MFASSPADPEEVTTFPEANGRLFPVLLSLAGMAEAIFLKDWRCFKRELVGFRGDVPALLLLELFELVVLLIFALIPSVEISSSLTGSKKLKILLPCDVQTFNTYE
jgi:hypothetical protein